MQGKRQRLKRNVKEKTKSVIEKPVCLKHLEPKANDINLIVSTMCKLVKGRHLRLEPYGGRGTRNIMYKPVRRRHLGLEQAGKKGIGNNKYKHVKRKHLALEHSGGKGIGHNMLNLLPKQAHILERLGW